MSRYYADKLSAEKLKKCYEIAPPRVNQYLREEINFVLSQTTPTSLVLELGCGYGRVLEKLCDKSHEVVGIDNSFSSLGLAAEKLINYPNVRLIAMDAVNLGFMDDIFDLTVCIQNGISAFHVDQSKLIREAIRVTKPHGMVLFSSYSEKFWSERLYWFELQAQAGLIGEIDNDVTGDGTIVCRDGFKATTVRPQQFKALMASLNLKAEIIEVDDSSVFCRIIA